MTIAMNPNDAVRKQILQYFYERNHDGTSTYGKKGSALKISDAKRELKAKFGLNQQSVMSNLNYLLDRGWVKKHEIQKTVFVNGGTIPATATWYRISAAGIDKIEGGSEYEPKDRYEGINVTATGTNVITLGDGNVVNAQFSELREHLDELKSQITTAALDEKQKFDVAVDIESLKDQLAKQNPDKTILGRLWSSIEHVTKLAGMIEASHKIWPYIKPFL
jgi:hypothetical protein